MLLPFSDATPRYTLMPDATATDFATERLHAEHTPVTFLRCFMFRQMIRLLCHAR